MTRESLQAKCNDKNLNLKILSVQKTEYEVYWVVYTRDLYYPGRDSYEDYIIEPELDELVRDEEEFILTVSFFRGKKYE